MPAIQTDVLIVGAGPAGLFQVFELGLREISAHVVDALPDAGGQCVELFGDKPIYDIPGVPACTGRELTERLLLQIRPFAPAFHFGQLVSQVERRPDGRFAVHTQDGLAFDCAAIVLAAGVGAFVPRTLRVDSRPSRAASCSTTPSACPRPRWPTGACWWWVPPNRRWPSRRAWVTPSPAARPARPRR